MMLCCYYAAITVSWVCTSDKDLIACADFNIYIYIYCYGYVNKLYFNFNELLFISRYDMI